MIQASTSEKRWKLISDLDRHSRATKNTSPKISLSGTLTDHRRIRRLATTLTCTCALALFTPTHFVAAPTSLFYPSAGMPMALQTSTIIAMSAQRSWRRTPSTNLGSVSSKSTPYSITMTGHLAGPGAVSLLRK